MARDLPTRIQESRIELAPIQVRLIETLLSGVQLDQALERTGVTVARLGRWVCDPVFRASFLAACDGYERMHAPAFWSHVRQRAMEDTRASVAWARMYADFLTTEGPKIELLVNPKPALESEDLSDADLADLSGSEAA